MSDITNFSKKPRSHASPGDDADILNIARQIRQRRIDIGMTQEQLALIAGVGRDLIIQIENGRSGVAIGKVSRILKTLGLTLTTMES